MASPQIAPRSTTHRAAVTNGKTLPRGIDQRSALARRYRDLVDGLMASIPGDLSEPDKLQVRNAASLQLHAEELTARMCRGEAVDPESITRAINGANRAISRLQKGRKAPRAAPSTVSEYLARRREEAAR